MLYVGVRAFQAVGEPDVPEKAMAGIPVGDGCKSKYLDYKRNATTHLL